MKTPPTITIRITHEQHAAMLRSQVPPGDEAGMEVTRQLEAVRMAVLNVVPDCEFRIEVAAQP